MTDDAGAGTDLALRESEQRFRGVFEHSNDAILIVDPAADLILDANPRACVMLGYSREELLKLSVSAIHPTEMAELNAFAEMVFAQGTGWTDELTCMTKGGGSIAADISASVVEVDGHPRMITIVRDVTERKQRDEARLNRLRHQRELILNSVGDGVLGLDLNNKVSFVNPAGARLLGWEVDELLGQWCSAFSMPPNDPEATCPLSEISLSGGIERNPDGTFYQRDGTPILVSYVTTPIGESGEMTGAVVSFTDISQRVRLEEELRQSQKLEAVGHLAGGIAHDFNNLLTGILGHAELLLLDTPADEPARASLDDIREGAERGAALVRQLLTFSRKGPAHPSVVDLNQLIEGLRRLLRPLIGEEIDVRTDLRARTALVSVEASQVEQVIMNLVLNAKDALSSGGTVVIATDTRQLDADEARGYAKVEPGEYIVLEVRDEGVGIEADVLPHVFEPFFSTKEEGQGTGLGLATAYGIIRRSGGHISVASEVGVGTTFTIMLPAAEAQETSDSTSRDRLGAVEEGCETVLVVEDDPLVRGLTHTILDRAGYPVLVAEGPREAIEIAESHPGYIDILLTDVVMPTMRGPELATHVRRERPSVNVLFMSGFSREQVELGERTAFIQKPFRRTDLLEALRRLSLDDAAPSHD